MAKGVLVSEQPIVYIYQSELFYIIEEDDLFEKNKVKNENSCFYIIYKKFIESINNQANNDYFYSFVLLEYSEKINLSGCFVRYGHYELYFINTLLHSIVGLLLFEGSNDSIHYMLVDYIKSFYYLKFFNGINNYLEKEKIRIVLNNRNKDNHIVLEETYELSETSNLIYKNYCLCIDNLTKLIKKHFTKQGSAELDIELLEKFVKYIFYSTSIITIRSYNKNYTEQLLKKLEK